MCTRITWWICQNTERLSPRPEFLSQVWGGVWESAFLTSFWMMPKPLGWGPCFENHWSMWPSPTDQLYSVNTSAIKCLLCSSSRCLNIQFLWLGNFLELSLPPRLSSSGLLGPHLCFLHHEFIYHFALPWWQGHSHSSVCGSWHIVKVNVNKIINFW